jgi:hypothetical protein
MILMRLIWLQLRSYPVDVDARTGPSLVLLAEATGERCALVHGDKGVASEVPVRRLEAPGAEATERWLASPALAALAGWLCDLGQLDEHQIVRFNQWTFVSTVLMATLMTRFIASSWTVALIVCAMLLSRGRLLAEIGHVSIDPLATLWLTSWLAACAHFLRTGATPSLLAAMACVLGGALIDRSLLALGLAMPLLLMGGYAWRRRLARPVIQRARGASRRRAAAAALDASAPDVGAWPGDEPKGVIGRLGRMLRFMLGMEFPTALAGRAVARPTYARGGLFRTIDVPFMLWVYSRRRWLRLSVAWLAVTLVAATVSVVLAPFLAGALGDGAGGGGGLGEVAAFLRDAWRGLEHWDGWRLAWEDPAWQRVDLHLGLSVGVVLLCAVQSPAAGLSSFLECSWLALLGCILVVLAARTLDGVDAGLVSALAPRTGFPLGLRTAVAWCEPVLLSLGAAGVYNLLKVLDTRVAEKT